MSNEQMDTFENGAVHDTSVSPDMNTQETDSGLDTFDSPNVVELESKDTEAKEGEGEPEKEEKPEVKRETDKLADQRDEEEGDEPAEEKADPEAEGKSGDDSSSEEEGDGKSEDSGDKPRGKTIRVKEGDEKYDLSLDATIPVKVKGRKEFVTLEELRQNYSGSKVWGEELAKVKESQATLDRDVESYELAKADTKAHFSKIGDLIEDAYSNSEADPLGAMKYLLELGGHDVLQFEKNLVEHYGNLNHQFDEMDEAEKDLYWAQRENEVLKSNQTAQSKVSEERNASEQRIQEMAKVREKYGVSETEYDATRTELTELGYDMKDVSPEQVSHYAALKEPIAMAEEICSQFQDDLSDDEMDALVSGTGSTLYENPNISEVEALRFSARKLGYELETEDDLMGQLQAKATKPKSVIDSSDKDRYRAVKIKENHVESFDDFDEMTYARR